MIVAVSALLIGDPPAEPFVLGSECSDSLVQVVNGHAQALKSDSRSANARRRSGCVSMRLISEAVLRDQQSSS